MVWTSPCPAPTAVLAHKSPPATSTGDRHPVHRGSSATTALLQATPVSPQREGADRRAGAPRRALPPDQPLCHGLAIAASSIAPLPLPHTSWETIHFQTYPGALTIPQTFLLPIPQVLSPPKGELKRLRVAAPTWPILHLSSKPQSALAYQLRSQAVVRLDFAELRKWKTLSRTSDQERRSTDKQLRPARVRRCTQPEQTNASLLLGVTGHCLQLQRMSNASTGTSELKPCKSFRHLSHLRGDPALPGTPSHIRWLLQVFGGDTREQHNGTDVLLRTEDRLNKIVEVPKEHQGIFAQLKDGAICSQMSCSLAEGNSHHRLPGCTPTALQHSLRVFPAGAPLCKPAKLWREQGATSELRAHSRTGGAERMRTDEVFVLEPFPNANFEGTICLTLQLRKHMQGKEEESSKQGIPSKFPVLSKRNKHVSDTEKRPMVN
ncbi:hypothetical protein Anapl_00186 [Anas platyrhynchos]|uniref:Uncharacterized protein n=1 Tax=Anas platyrhynchos TaxID=8839 RepID=R0LR32_ANAPL|nr:hypothetical protein Anapl_00186 [Anas platyrhynchos]